MTRGGPDGWCGLLVSVRDEEEAREALAGGAAIVDVKEPGRGPLGAPDAEIAAAIGALVGRRVPWTVACGELVAGPGQLPAREVAAAVRAGLATVPPHGAKAGPAGCGPAEWRGAFAAFAAALPSTTIPIAVAYADWRRAAAPPPEAIIAAAAEVAGCGALLIDTFDKRGPTVLEGTAPEVLRGWIAAARLAGLATALAGRLSTEALAAAAALGPDVLAIRGAACVGGRDGRVRRHQVEAAVQRCGRLGGLEEPLRPTPARPGEIVS
jgi:uncharacterized protein (UPF0264 family)